jgi:hypothetical protein
MSQHITLYEGSFGINVAAAQANFIGAAWIFRSVANVQFGYVYSGGIVSVTGLAAWGSTPPASKPTVTGAKGSNAALASLMTALVAYGLVTDSTTA